MQQKMLEKTISVAITLAAVWKSKILRYNTACTNRITLDREDLENVESFNNLGSDVDEHGRSDADVKARISKA
ncbi:unnamed protein product [Schistosoma mattheei]|uniref:Uncharacterized protein n=1 Tax=Schistosoma mattheei TaxID=31246 RepID=A0A183P868_9TREM|nr:unnamed protein product [Schistosoma mattheei]